MEFTLSLGGEPFGKGVSGEAMELPPFGEREFTVEVVSSTGESLAQLRRLAEGAGTALDYTLEGEAWLRERSGRLPFSVQGSALGAGWEGRDGHWL